MSKDKLAQVSDMRLWIQTFSTTNTVDVSMWPQNFYWLSHWSMTCASASEVLGSLIEHCPNLQRLKICPLCPVDDYFGTDPTPAHPTSVQTHWHEYLQEFPALCHLSLPDERLSYSRLIALGNLPTLERLELHMGGFDGFSFLRGVHVNSDVPVSTFPSLRRLSLQNVASFDVNRLLNIKWLFSGITELEIDHSLYCDFEKRGNWIIFKLIPSLVSAPGLKTLRVTDSSGLLAVEEADLYPMAVPEFLHAMTQLPLQVVRIDTVYFGTGRFKPTVSF